MMKGWSEVDKPRRSGSFLQLEDGETKRIRVLDEAPWTTYVHRISQNLNGNDVFLTVQETERPDEDFIAAFTNRYPAMPQHHLRVLVYNDDGEPEGVKVLSGGVQIFRPLKGYVERYEDIREFDIEITRNGSKRETEYTVTVAPKSYTVDLAEWLEKADDEIDMEKLFRPPTPEQQRQMIEQAGVDLSYDPAEALMAEMTVEEALNMRFPFGKKYGPDAYPPAGKKIGEILAIDAGFVQWAALNVTSDDAVAAACRLAIQHMDQLDAGAIKRALGPGKASKSAAPTRPVRSGPTAKGKATETPQRPRLQVEEEAGEEEAPEWTLRMSPADYLEKFPKGPKAPLARRLVAAGEEEEVEEEEVEEEPQPVRKIAKAAKVPVKKAKEDSAQLVVRAMRAFDSNPAFAEPTAIVDAIKRHGGGQTRLKDLSAAQLESLLGEIENGEE